MSPTRPADATDPAAPEDRHALPLPNPRHGRRVPSHIGRAGIERLRAGLHTLPQVLKPADFGEVDGPGTDARLEAMGLVKLQAASGGGARPSRWMAPVDFDAALAHLDAAGTGPGARPLMLERRATLESRGIVREGLAFRRLASQSIAVPVPRGDDPRGDAGRAPPPWRLALRFQVPVPADWVWAFFASGDETALAAAIAAEHAQHPDAEAVGAHLARLVARSHALAPERLDALLPRLQAECAVPQPTEALKAALTRAQDRWEQQVGEATTLESLTHELAFQGYPDSFPKARALARRVTLFVGPPNSGKTHAAFERLAAAAHGCYLAPLRLLALEGRDRLVARGVPCSLLTGEENVPADGARVVSSTIEMVDTNRTVDVAVVDEAQMIFDASRGWAWTQALVAVPAEELIVIASEFAVPALERLLGLCGERCTIRRFERKQHVQLLPRAVPLALLARGDAVVAFSRRDVLTLRDRIAADGHSVSVIYGALPPEVRRREAERYASGASDVLVATDAIGMGLNLPIRRVLFSTLEKFDGETERTLDDSEVHQIAGRAGRFGMHEEGFAGVLDLAEPSAAKRLKEALARSPRAPRDFKAPVAPGWWHLQTISKRLHKTRLREVLGVFVSQLKLDDTHFAVAELDAMLELAEALDASAAKLSLRERFVYAQAPVDTRTEGALQDFLEWAASHAHTGRAGRPGFLDAVDGHSRLDRMEQALRACTLWLWLDLRFPGAYGLVDEVQALRSVLNDGIERQLKGHRPLAFRRSGGRRR